MGFAMAKSVKRRLAAILVADVVGYSRLMGDDEAGALAALKSHRVGLIDPKIAEHDGRIVKVMGDGLLVEFTSIVEGVECAVEIQREMAERNSPLPVDRRIELRIGINLGDVIVEDDDIHGNGVNVAARLESLCEPGGVTLSDDAYRQIRDRLHLALLDGGKHEAKNIAHPIRVWHWSPTGQQTAKRLPLPEKPSIAVLPFDNLSDDPEQEYFADGIVEDIITALSKFRWFFIIARNSSFSYKGKTVSVTQVARDLGVRYVLQGSVRRAGSRVRINAQLIDVTTGSHLWAERYDRELDDIFELQDEITTTIVGAIEPQLGEAERRRAKRKSPENLDAWDRYQRALWHYWQRERKDAEEAGRLFQSAIELDPSFSSAYAGLSEVCYIKLHHGWTDTPEETLSLGLSAAQQAVSLDDKDGFAHFAFGRMNLLQGQLEIAIVELKKAIDLNPNLAIAYYGLSIALLWSGHAQEALPFAQKAVRQSPHDPLLFAFEEIAGAAHFQLGEYAEAAEWSEKASQHPTSSFWTHTHLATALIELDRLEEARTAIQQALRKQPDLSVTNVCSMLARMHPRYRQRILDCLRWVGLPE
jgi:adenylate cyclase